MTDSVNSADSEKAAAAWHEIETLVDRVSTLARTDAEPDRFFQTLLDCAVTSLAAEGGVVWLRDSHDVTSKYQLQFPLKQLSLPSHRQLVLDVLESGEPRMVAGDRYLQPGNGTSDQTECLLLLSPLFVNSQAIGVLEVLRLGSVSPRAEGNLLRLLATFGEFTADYHDQRELRRLRSRESSRTRRDEFVHNLHSTLDVAATAYAIANDGRLCIECDRLTVLEARDSRCKTLAISGVDALNHRAGLCGVMQRLAECVATGREEIWYPVEEASLAPHVVACLQDHVDQSHARRLAAVPLLDPADSSGDDPPAAVIGVLIAEEFKPTQEEQPFRVKVKDVSDLASLALRNAFRHQRMPLMPLSRGLQRAAKLFRTRHRPGAWGVLLALVTVCAAIILFPVDFQITARGQLRPELRRDVFATADGVVQRLLVDHGDDVKTGQSLVELTQSELDFSMIQIVGELQTAQQELLGVRAKRWHMPAATANDQENQLAAAEEQLRQRIAGLEEQRDILHLQQDQLHIRSPIDGRVVTWNPSQLLLTRPVRRGQKLLSIDDVSGPWVLELLVDDQDIGHVIQAQDRLHPDLDVYFLLATDASVTHRGRIADVAKTTRQGELGETAVMVTVRIDQPTITAPRPGATVVAKIDCGRRTLGYVWLHELLDAMRIGLMF